MKFTEDYLNKINKVQHDLAEADAIIIGVGAGLSAAGGVNYMDPQFTKELFPGYYNKGFNNIMEIQSNFWRIQYCDPQEYWAYWASHIYQIRYKMPILEPYKLLFEILKDKNIFFISTNVDGQLKKVNFNIDLIFEPQGEYNLFQCIQPCSNDLHYNEKYIINMLNDMEDEFRIKKENIPICPNCGKYLIPNLRCDDTFVEEPHLIKQKDYYAFIEANKNKKNLFLELGVGFNTPGIIRFPFERFVNQFENSKLIRINKGDVRTSFDLDDRAILIENDLKQTFIDILNK